MYAMRDKLSGFQTPIPFVNQETAERWFRTQCLENPTIKDQPGDFELHLIGEFDSETGKIESMALTEVIAKGESYV